MKRFRYRKDKRIKTKENIEKKEHKKKTMQKIYANYFFEIFIDAVNEWSDRVNE